MSERKATELRTAATLSRTVNVVADRLGRAVSLFAGGRPVGLLAIPTTAVGQPPDDGNRSGPESVSTEVARWQDLVGAERVLIIDDCTLFRENLAVLLADKGIAVAGTAWDLPSLVAALDETNANLMLVNMGTRDTHLLIRAAMGISPGTRIIVVGAPEEDEQKIIACAEVGVAGSDQECR